MSFKPWFLKVKEFIVIHLSISDHLIFYKGTLISFNHSPVFFGNQDIGVVFWSNGTKSPLRMFKTKYDQNEENVILTDLGTIPVIHKQIVYMTRN